MNSSAWARRALLSVVCVLPLTAGNPTWNLQPGTELVLTPSDGAASVVLIQNQLTLNSNTVLTVTPDPLGLSTSHQWVLPAGTVISLYLSPGLTLRRVDLAQSVEIEVITKTSPNTFAPMMTTSSASTLVINPDPGTGNEVPPTGGH
ncbi:MAG TPA: hypothetical protein VNV60_09495 [Holophagaceae bacterium]|jgi:hypothetical protein|nr:hypothetical protein [Holophagaceae bacterium]